MDEGIVRMLHTAIVTNLSERCAAFSALTILARRKSAKARDLAKRPPGGSGGPNIGTDLERDTATLEKRRFQFMFQNNRVTILELISGPICYFEFLTIESFYIESATHVLFKSTCT